MAALQKGRYTATLDEPCVLFLIGMRVNKPWKVWRWWQVVVAMPRILRALARHPELGLLHTQGGLVSGQPLQLCYFRSLEHLYRFASDPDQPHLEPWRRLNQTVRDSGDVGIWHETYLVQPGAAENVYVNMPPWLLGAAVGTEPAGRRGQSARRRAGLTDRDESTVAPF